QDDYEAGIEAGVTAILSVLDGAYMPVGDRQPDSAESVAPLMLFFLFVTVVSLMRYYKANGTGRSRRGWGYGPGWTGGGRRGGLRGGGGFRGGGGGFGGGGASGSW